MRRCESCESCEWRERGVGDSLPCAGIRCPCVVVVLLFVNEALQARRRRATSGFEVGPASSRRNGAIVVRRRNRDSTRSRRGNRGPGSRTTRSRGRALAVVVVEVLLVLGVLRLRRLRDLLEVSHAGLFLLLPPCSVRVLFRRVLIPPPTFGTFAVIFWKQGPAPFFKITATWQPKATL